MRRIHVLIYGLVQGVFFRDNTKKLADTLGIKGFVRNVNNHVEAVFEGQDESIDEILKFCRKGPVGSVVKNIEVHEENYKNEFKDFKILR